MPSEIRKVICGIDSIDPKSSKNNLEMQILLGFEQLTLNPPPKKAQQQSHHCLKIRKDNGLQNLNSKNFSEMKNRKNAWDTPLKSNIDTQIAMFERRYIFLDFGGVYVVMIPPFQ